MLTMQQELVLANLKYAVKNLTKEQLEEEIISLTEVLFRKENACKQFFMEVAGFGMPSLGERPS